MDEICAGTRRRVAYRDDCAPSRSRQGGDRVEALLRAQPRFPARSMDCLHPGRRRNLSVRDEDAGLPRCGENPLLHTAGHRSHRHRTLVPHQERQAKTRRSAARRSARSQQEGIREGLTPDCYVPACADETQVHPIARKDALPQRPHRNHAPPQAVSRRRCLPAHHRDTSS